MCATAYCILDVLRCCNTRAISSCMNCYSTAILFVIIIQSSTVFVHLEVFYVYMYVVLILVYYEDVILDDYAVTSLGLIMQHPSTLFNYENISDNEKQLPPEFRHPGYDHVADYIQQQQQHNQQQYQQQYAHQGEHVEFTGMPRFYNNLPNRNYKYTANIRGYYNMHAPTITGGNTRTKVNISYTEVFNTEDQAKTYLYYKLIEIRATADVVITTSGIRITGIGKGVFV